jgi:hypothetical protein
VPIATFCPQCSKEYHLADSQRGKTVVCRGCDAAFVVEDEERRPAGRSRRDEEEDDRPRRSRREDDDDRPRRSRRDEEDDGPRRDRRDEEEDRPRRSRRDEDEDDPDPDRRPRRRDRDEEEEEEPRKKQKSSGMMLWLLLGGGGLGLLVVVGVVVLFATGALGPSRVTPENYAKLKHGMSLKEVEAILGSGTDVTKQQQEEADKIWKQVGGFKVDLKGYKAMKWESGKNKIIVTFVNDKVRNYSGTFEVKGGTMVRQN